MAKILVADDNSNIQKMVGLALKDQGIDVVAVGNGEAAVRKISDIRPDLVLADVFMPVRNGYEVCRYVKEDSTLSHIPVILLVGAFDPLDEQEAQRVGADGVLKKPFVPPDPLISMVKSALTRAGIKIGNEPAPAEKTPEPVGRGAKELLMPAVSSKIAALSPAAVPEAEAEPLPEEFPTPPPAVKIAAGTEPVAFGSLLETPESEDDLAMTAKPLRELEEARNWGNGSATDEVEEEEEEEHVGKGGWSPGGLDESLEEIAVPSGKGKAKDWREEAFHGNSPANISSGRRWTPAETTQIAEVAEAPSVGVSTLESKPSEAPAPFAGDAWAAVLATTVEDKITQVTEAPAETSKTVEAAPAAMEQSSVAADVAHEPQIAEPANWSSVTETPWELEAKKASQLASTWDSPAPPAPAVVSEAEKFLEEEQVGVSEAPTDEIVPGAAEAKETPGVEIAEGKGSEVYIEHAPLVEPTHEEPAESVYVAEEPLNVNDTQEIPVYQDSEPSYVATSAIEESSEVHAVEETAAEHVVAENITAGAKAEEAPAHGIAEASTSEPQQPDMDALVARVLSKMNPDVLQKVTREILKPVIEALIKDELDSKK